MDQKPNLNSQKPFLIKKIVNARSTLLSPESSNFDERIEGYVRFVQGANAFVAIGLSYDSIKNIYYHFALEGTCKDYATALIVVILHNLYWVITSLIGIRSINSRKSSNIKAFVICIMVLFLTRCVLFGLMYHTSDQADLGENKCDAVYQNGYFIIQFTIEGVFILILLILSFRIWKYVKKWEFNERMLPAGYVEIQKF